MKTGPVLATFLAALALGACQAGLPDMPAPERVSTRNEAPPWAEPGTCWGKDETPAVIETVTEQVILEPAELVEPAEDGSVARPAAYRTKTRQKIVTPRRDTWFETPCEEQLTPQFTASLQRALRARGHYHGPITAELDRRTRRAIRAYQMPQGLDSAMISLAAARQMGLVTVETGQLAQTGRILLQPRAAETRVTRDAPAPAAPGPKARPEKTPVATPESKPEPAADAAKPAPEPARTPAAIRQDLPGRVAQEAEKAAAARRAAELKAALEAEANRRADDATPLRISTEPY